MLVDEKSGLVYHFVRFIENRFDSCSEIVFLEIGNKEYEVNQQFQNHTALTIFLSVFAYFLITSSMVFFRDYAHLVKSSIALMVPQIIMAYAILYFLIPKFLNHKKYLKFGLSLFLILIIVFVGYVATKKFYFDVEYVDTYTGIAREFMKLSMLEQLVDPNFFFSKLVKFLTPTALLFTYRLYKNQQDVLQLREQKRLAELSALKNQLNPHFLFNTLNNLYALALEKSEKTPEVIERLSEILDYMLYRCKDKYVLLHKEIELIENYLALEKIRYGKRVQINFIKESFTGTKIAPLIILTFIENAFKHGVSQELDVAEIEMKLEIKDQQIIFYISNTKPKAIVVNQNSESMGLVNIQKQLDLLYPNEYTLDIKNSDDRYEVQLNIPAYDL